MLPECHEPDVSRLAQTAESVVGVPSPPHAQSPTLAAANVARTTEFVVRASAV